MKNELNLGGFTEMTATEAEMVDGGSIFSDVLGIVNTTVGTIASVVPIIGLPVIQVTQMVTGAIATMAEQIYKIVGWDFYGTSPLLKSN